MPSDKKQKPVTRRRAQASWLLHAFVCLLLLALAPVSSKAMGDQSERVSIQTDNSSRKPELVAQLGHSDMINSAIFSPDGKCSEREVNAEVLARAISGEELSEWIRDVDAGEMVMVVEACQSAGTVKGEGGEEFKPGPMGSRGLGQLAYDKGMRILAASQADDFAFELEELQHGLLTFALINDGIQARKADMNKDAKITLSEALVYSLERVPKLYEAMVKKELKKLFESEGGKGPVVTGAAASLNRKNTFQRASLFDFAKGRREVVLVK